MAAQPTSPLGTLYYSLRGFGENGTFRYRGSGDDFFNAHFSALQDRGFDSPSVDANGNPITVYTNQGGEDITAASAASCPNPRAGDAEYLSSYVYREAFTENFNQAVSTDINSILYITHQSHGYSLDARADRYEGLKVVPTNTTPGEEVKIFHVPPSTSRASTTPSRARPSCERHRLRRRALPRVQPNFATCRHH